MARRLPGLDKFMEALGSVARVPKAEVEARIAANKGTGAKGAAKRLKKQRKKK